MLVPGQTNGPTGQHAARASRQDGVGFTENGARRADGRGEAGAGALPPHTQGTGCRLQALSVGVKR